MTTYSMTIMPVSLEEVVAAIGEADTLKLIDRYGGTSPRFPSRRNINPNHPIAQVIGVQQLKKLVAAVDGARYVYIPKCADGLRQKRDREIVAKYVAGQAVERLAIEYKLCDRQIWNILKKTEMETAQADLF